MQGSATTITNAASTRRKITAARNGVVSGSLLDSRTKMDQVKGGIKVSDGSKSCDNGDDDVNANEEAMIESPKPRTNQTESIVPGKKKMRSWPPPAATPTDEVLVAKSPIQLRKVRSDLSSNSPRSRVAKSLEFAGEKKPVLRITDGSEGDGDHEVAAEMEEDGSSFDDKEMDLSTVEEEKTVNEIPEDENKVSLIVSSEETENNQNTMIPPSMEIEEKPACEVVSSVVPVEKKQNSAIIQNPTVVSSVLLVQKKQNHMDVSSVVVEKKLNHVNFSSVTVERKQIPVTEPALEAEIMEIPQIPRRRINVDSPELRPSTEVPEQMFPDPTHDCHNRMQTIVDLVMWRDVSKSAFVFGLGTFVLISSSYTKDLNFSIISAGSYAGLIYLALIFTYKSILHRGESTEEYEASDERFIIGENEVIWLTRIVLPYINGVLVGLKALFSGDPATTMKLAVLLFVLARCGSSITIWSLIKLVFFAVFTIPKVCSSYSHQLTKYGKFWLDRIRDGWESCTHKKAVAAGIFTLIWNISSTAARIWALFMLVVAFKLYQQCVGKDCGIEEGQEEVDEIRVEDSKPAVHNRQGIGNLQQNRQRGGTARAVVGHERKVKKWH